MKKKYIINALITFFIFAVVTYLFLTFSCYVVCLHTVNKLPEPRNQEFLRVKLYGSTYSDTGNTVSAIFSLMDSNENEIATIERSWSGSYLAAEFVFITIQSRRYGFPLRIYGKNKIVEEKIEKKQGTNLEKYYNYNNQCMLFAQGYTDEDRKNFYRLSKYATRKYPFFNLGQIGVYSVDLSACKPYRYYSVGINKSGKIYIEEL